MTDTYQVQRRSVTGKRVATLRREGILPANVYGRAQDSVAVQLPYVDARDLLNAHGLNTLVNVQIEDEPETRPVVVRNVELEPVSRKILHLDMYQVDLARIIKATIPITITGEAPAVHKFGGILIHALDHIEVEGLPHSIPEHIEVSVSGLIEVGDHIQVKDLRVPAGLKLHAAPDQGVVAIQASRTTAPAVEGSQD
ncbi:MAG: 50S ribosomal protein L25 [Dehalococcoidia bacterium]|nr:MAG: 50S ribosomal protein L25 [Dehalococcoidia bacterium]